MAVGVGFEPTKGDTLAGFQDRCLKPLGHPTTMEDAVGVARRESGSPPVAWSRQCQIVHICTGESGFSQGRLSPRRLSEPLMPLIHVFGNLLVCILATLIGWALARNRKTLGIGIGTGVAVGFSQFLISLYPHLFINLFPFTNVIYYTNLFPNAALLALPGLIALGKTTREKQHIAILGAMLAGVALIPYLDFTRKQAHSNGSVIDSDGVARQTSSDTCAAASAVTLLRLYDIETNEAEMVRLALTKDGAGTTAFGLYRGLRMKTNDHPDLHVRVDFLKLDELLARNQPAIITVGLPRFPSREALEFGQQFQWDPGVIHDCVFLGRDPDHPGHALIGEPEFGLESWPTEHLRFLFWGHTMWIEKRNRTKWD